MQREYLGTFLLSPAQFCCSSVFVHEAPVACVVALEYLPIEILVEQWCASQKYLFAEYPLYRENT
jgi:hypothetical protein